MIAKGHHFENVTLVVIANADLGFLSADFRSPEHTAQRIIQVAGRAGRAKKPGKVLIQTLQPDNALLTQLVRQGYHAFAHELLHERSQLGLPPLAMPYSFVPKVYTISKQRRHHRRQRIDTSQSPFAINAPIDAPMTKKITAIRYRCSSWQKLARPCMNFCRHGGHQYSHYQAVKRYA